MKTLDLVVTVVDNRVLGAVAAKTLVMFCNNECSTGTEYPYASYSDPGPKPAFLWIQI